VNLPELSNAEYLQLRSEALRGPIFQDVIHALNLPDGSRGLDVGCGIGLQTLQLAEAVGKQGHVTGLDQSPIFLETARTFAQQVGLAESITFRPGDWNDLPFENDTFDWVWSADAAGYAPQEPAPLIRELGRVLKPGGRLVILFWSSQMLLPGYPALEARLNASRAGTAPFAAGSQPEKHALRTLGWLRAAGLVDARAETRVGSVFAPLDASQRAALTDLLEMRWGGAEPDVSAQDWQEYQRLSRSESADFILNCPDYYAFFTYSVFSASVPGPTT
jgi:SAM-dependent methyltransferase